MLAAVCADQFTSMRPLGGGDGAEVRAALPTVISRTFELDAQADKRRLRLGEKQVELPAPHHTRPKPGTAPPSCSRCHWVAALMQVSLPARGNSAPTNASMLVRSGLRVMADVALPSLDRPMTNTYLLSSME